MWLFLEHGVKHSVNYGVLGRKSQTVTKKVILVSKTKIVCLETLLVQLLKHNILFLLLSTNLSKS